MKKDYIVLFIGNVFILCFTTFLLYLDKKNRESIYIQSKINQLASELEIEADKFDNIANIFFSTKVENDSILEILKQSDFSKRYILYTKFYKDYKILRKYGFERFMFVLPDGTVYLRFHNFNKYGDKLSDVIEFFKANDSLSIMDKRFLDSLVFYFPIYYHKQLIGSIYLNVPFYKVSQDLSKTFGKEYIFIVSKEFINLKESKSFIESDLSKDYFIEGQILKNIKNYELINQFNQKAKNDITEKLSSKESFVIFKEIDEKIISATFYSIKNLLQNKHVGFIVSYEEDNTFSISEKTFLTALGFLFTLLIIINIFIFYVLKLKKVAEEKAITDKLTGLFNRNIIDNLVEIEYERSKRTGKPISVILFDIDHFKKINDTYGHDKGDYVLKTVAQIARKTLRKSDYIIRWGGEEFLIILPETDLKGAITVAEKIRQNVENFYFKDISKVTVSLGVTQIKKNENLENAIKRADQALYLAKNKGRNRVEFIY
ncbi:GGDEF domain-containing protein [Sulfurihydrogenibium subterraneum]|uniref:GGDEF domain-containing protein n=1 Tax=Sulfurihydrogenibium subterraneum TaxID=171121 RepID=UPI00068785D9|nr:GGDEF domain-containing protein [Sulfurihydrogenibium subterraneum]